MSSRIRTTEQVAEQLTRASRKSFYDVTTKLEWPESIEPSCWAMSPEFVSLYGTELWAAMDDQRRKRLAFHEIAGFFSVILNGERPLLEGVSHRLYTAEKNLTVTEYMHHFLDEENKHMMMFSTYLRRYVGKVYPEKKIPHARPMAKGEEDVVFFAKVLVVEEISDYYNVAMGRDERLPKIIRDLNWTHHVDEARHILFGRSYLKQLWDGVHDGWTPREVASFRSWLVEYIDATWRDLYNPSVYRDAGIADPYDARQSALRSATCRQHRQTSSAKLLQNLIDCGILMEIPTLQ